MAKRGGMEAVIEKRMVRDPAVSDAEFWHQKHLKPNKPNIGMTEANVNLKEFIGGFWRYQSRTEAQTMAAARFKSIHEACQVGGAKAVDLTAVRVDSSMKSATLFLERGDQARATYRKAVTRLGMQRASLIENVVIYDMSQVRIAKAYGYGGGRTGRRRVQELVYAAMNELALHYNL